MAEIKIKESDFERLRSKVVVLTGGASGIGKTAIRDLVAHGAKVVFGDVNRDAGAQLQKELDNQAVFVTTDVNDWNSQCHLFEHAFQTFGSIDYVCANAGIPERGPWIFEDILNSSGELQEPDLRIIDINLKGVILTCKLAIHYFQKNKTPGGAIVITGSAASYFAASPIILYGAAKHGLLGLMRSLAVVAEELHFRINLVAPWLTATEFSSELHDLWGDRPMNTQKEVSDAILHACVDGTLNGRGLFVAKQVVDIEAPMHQLEPRWLGEDVYKLWEMGRAHLLESFGKKSKHYLEN